MFLGNIYIDNNAELGLSVYLQGSFICLLLLAVISFIDCETQLPRVSNWFLKRFIIFFITLQVVILLLFGLGIYLAYNYGHISSVAPILLIGNFIFVATITSSFMLTREFFEELRGNKFHIRNDESLKIIEKLERKVLKPELLAKLRQNESQCAICMEEYIINDTIMDLPCNHMYHDLCIMKWLMLKRICPLCKKELKIKES